MKRRRRTRSRHPGVKLKRRLLPSGGISWRACYRDPDSGRTVYVTLDPAEVPTQEAREQWAIRKYKALAKRRMDLEAGGPLRSETPLAQAIDDFYEASEHRLEASTLATYRHGIERLRQWAQTTGGVRFVEELNPGRLATFRAALIAGQKQTAARGHKRGARKAGKGKRAAITTNTYLTSCKILLNHFRKLGIAPALSRDTITDALKPLPLRREQPVYLPPTKLQKLLQAAIRHDADVFAETRAEHARLRPRGSTPRHEPIAPFVAFLLLSGCRRGEALKLTWAEVDLDAIDDRDRKVGEIRLRAEQTKTRRARLIGLEVSPALRKLLVQMKLCAGRNADALYLFGGAKPYSVDTIQAARRRLVREYGAPTFDWQALRSTCATFLTNAPGIFGSASAFHSSRQLGHSMAVAERSYLGVHRGIPVDARTLEAAMHIEPTLEQTIATLSAPRGAKAELTRINTRSRKVQA